MKKDPAEGRGFGVRAMPVASALPATTGMELRRRVEPKNVVPERVGQADGIRCLGQSATELEIGLLPPLRLFCSYARKDDRLRNQFEIHLKLLQRKGIIASWHDRLIRAGERWGEGIAENLEQADLIVLLVSPDFIASDYCWDIEMARALERHESGEAWVVPVIVRDVDWSIAPFSRLQALPRDGRAVKCWRDRDAAWRNVVEGIRAVAEGLQRTKA
jgi:TIR domain